MQLQNAKQKFEAQGLKLAAISYDSPAILKDFAERHNIDFPLLADPARRERMGRAAAGFGRLDADHELAAMVRTAAGS